MAIRLAIHHRPGSFSDRWIESCREQSIDFEMVNGYDPGIMSRLREFDAFVWHWHHGLAADILAAPPVLMSAEMMGLAVFPSRATCWHFDSKLAQKYLLESVGAPLVPTWVFYTLQEAMDWIAAAELPKVFKLSRGAGSANVRLIRTRQQAERLARRAFARGFNPVAGYLQDSTAKLRTASRSGSLAAKIRRAPRTFLNLVRMRRQMNPERGYFYVQEFVPGNSADTRVTVIGERAFGFMRQVRKGDFRASGSGSLVYDVQKIDPRCLRIAFDVTRKLDAQSVAFDFLAGSANEPLITEISYAYMAKAIYDCAGHWDSTLAWHEGHIWPQDAILTDLLGLARERTRQ